MGTNEKNTQQMVKEFFDDSWRVYQKFIQYDYMQHNLMYAKFSQLMREKYSNTSLSILDLGCGDASHIAKVLNSVDVSQYTGLDISNTALCMAKENLSGIITNLEFIQKDFIDGMKDKVCLGETYDVVFAAYALHHYTTYEKQIFLDNAKQLLKKNGCLVLIDLILEDGQNLDEFFSITMPRFYKTLDMLTSKEFNLAVEHISSSDIPESFATYRQLAQNGLFANCELLFKHEFFAFLLFT